MPRNLLVPAIGSATGVGGMTATHHHLVGESVELIAARDIKEQPDGKDMKAAVVEVTIGPGHPACPVAIRGRGSSTFGKMNTNSG